MNSKERDGEDKDMRFRTIVVTKRRLTVFVLCTAAAAAAVFWAARADTAARLGEEIYSAMIDESIGKGGGAKAELERISKAAAGFDMNEPQTIVGNYMGSDAEDTAELPQDTPVPPAEEEVQIPAEGLPSKAEIDSAGDISLNNATDYSVNLGELCAEDLDFKIDMNEVSVLVMHTHTTECYDGDEMPGETERTTDESKNMIEVGNVICDTLEEYGIRTYHDTAFHDYPSYQGSYTRAMTTIEQDMSEYPGIRVVLDVHRDAFVYEDGTKLTVTYDGAEIPTSRVMIVSGTDSMGLYNPNWRENLKFAAKIQNAAELMYPGFMRPINLREERFNLHATEGSLILEVGSNGNTLEEAKNAGRNIAKAIAAVLVND